MDRQNCSKMVHFLGMIWFVICTGYMLAYTVLRADKGWRIWISLSGYSMVLMLFLIGSYLFAIFRGVARSQQDELEHPLTSAGCYCLFYNTSSFIGALAGGLAAINITRIAHYPLMIAAGSLSVNFLVWIVVDPLLAAVEMLLPTSRQHRAERLANARRIRRQELLAKEQTLAELETSEQQELQIWNRALQTKAKELAALLSAGPAVINSRRGTVVDLGVDAWQLGGTGCMQHLHSMAMQICEDDSQDAKVVDSVSSCWCGIGNW